jgi:hypothetical protein
MYKVQCFLFHFASVLLLEWRQLDTLLISFHSSICFLQRTVKHVLFCSISVLFRSCKGKYVSIMGSERERRYRYLHIHGSEWEVDISAFTSAFVIV